MPIDVKVPPAGESVTEAILAKWLKKDGEYVKADEPIVEMETDKASQEIPAPASGTLHTAVAEGTTVPVGAVIARIEEGVAVSPADEPKANRPSVAADSPLARPPAKPVQSNRRVVALGPRSRTIQGHRSAAARRFRSWRTHHQARCR